MKVYLYYLKNKLYAFTTNKVYKSDFEYQRNMECFTKRVETMDSTLFQAFSYKEKNKMMIEIPLSDSTDEYFMIIGTPEEEIKLDQTVSDMDKEFSDILKYLKQIPFKKKYKKAIKSLSVISELRKISPKLPESDEEEIENLYTINFLSLFYNLFKDTFETNKREE